MPVGRARARLAVAESRDVPRRGFWDARRDAASHFIRGASMAWRWTPSPRSRGFLTQVAPKEAPARVPAGNGVAGRAASNRDLVAAEPKEQTVAILEDDVVALPVACGEMAFRGDALEPIIKQRGSYAASFLCRRHAIDASARWGLLDAVPVMRRPLADTPSTRRPLDSLVNTRRPLGRPPGTEGRS